MSRTDAGPVDPANRLTPPTYPTHPTHRAVAPTDPAHLRQCLGRFATGVTIVATRDSNGRFVGLTANSFNSLSLDPPLILWSLSNRATSLDVFKRQRFFSISVLAVEQVEIARRFATRLPDRFSGVAVHEGLDGIPLIDGAVAWFECERRTQTLQGDHWLFVGEVKRCASADGSPLVFRHGEFAAAGALGGSPPSPAGPAVVTVVAAGAAGAASPHAAIQPGEPDGLEPGDQPFYEEYLPYLLSRAGHEVSSGFHRQLRRHGLSMLAWRVLAALSSRSDWTIGELCAVSLAKQPTVSKLVDRLARQRLVDRRDDPSDARRTLISLTPAGRETMTPVLEDAAAFNLSLLAQYSPEVLTGLKQVLREMIACRPG